MLKWIGENTRALFATYGWLPALIVIVVLALLATGILWFLHIDVMALFGG
jgi:hypothetical protein